MQIYKKNSVSLLLVQIFLLAKKVLKTEKE